MHRHALFGDGKHEARRRDLAALDDHRVPVEMRELLLEAYQRLK